jgi:transcriptional regulator with XRE-family HTH domain
MKEANISKNIAELRKKKGITQEQLALALNISPQAVSKWETGTSQPDVQTLPLIADYFGVGIDYIFYGKEYTSDNIYNNIWDKVAEHPQMSKEAYEEAFTIFAYAHHGIGRWNNKDRIPAFHDEPFHLTSENGLSIISGKGYGAIVTRAFFESVNRDTAEFASKILPVLGEKDNLIICMAIISMSDISFTEMQEKLGFDESILRARLDALIKTGIVIEKKSKHKSLGFTYDIHDMYHTCLCVLIATLEMQRYSLGGISCCMGYGDYPIKL